MSVDQGLIEWVRECLGRDAPRASLRGPGDLSPKHLEPIGVVTMRRMMGAATLYLDGTIFAVQDDGELWFKADGESDAIWDEAGCDRFTFTGKDGRKEVMNYRRAPSDVYDDPDEMRRWAQLAVEAGLRGAAKKRPKKAQRP
jgi:DNA transformation protein and related proteins